VHAIAPLVGAGGEVAEGTFMIVHRQANLLDIIGTRHPPSRLTGRLHGRQEKTNEHADDGDHHEQFNKRERPSRDTESGHRKPHTMGKASGKKSKIKGCGIVGEWMAYEIKTKHRKPTVRGAAVPKNSHCGRQTNVCRALKPA